MNELVKITERGGSQLVDARELHDFLEVKSEFRNWIKNRIEEYGFVENEDFTPFGKNLPKPEGGRPSKEYAIKLDMAKELAMVERNDKGREARRYFIAVEKQYRENLVKVLEPESWKSIASEWRSLYRAAVEAKTQEQPEAKTQEPVEAKTQEQPVVTTVSAEDGFASRHPGFRGTDAIIDARNVFYDTVYIKNVAVGRIKLTTGTNYYKLNDVLSALGSKAHPEQKAIVINRFGNYAQKMMVIGRKIPIWFCTGEGINATINCSPKFRGKKVVIREKKESI
jgi:phage anti-repressor protein